MSELVILPETCCLIGAAIAKLHPELRRATRVRAVLKASETRDDTGNTHCDDTFYTRPPQSQSTPLQTTRA